jgi:hypothetical protein
MQGFLAEMPGSYSDFEHPRGVRAADGEVVGGFLGVVELVGISLWSTMAMLGSWE